MLHHKIGDFAIEGLEEVEVRVRLSVQHGDLHGGNILVTDSGDPVIIDYGEIGEFVCCLDRLFSSLATTFTLTHESISKDQPR